MDFSTIRDKMGLLSLNNELQSSGLTPVFRVVTQSSYHDEQLGTRLLIDTLPLSLRTKIDHTKVRHDYVLDDVTSFTVSGLGTIPGLSTISVITSDVRGTITGSIRSVIKGVDSVDDRSLVGFEIESTVHPGQPYPTLHGIFNVRATFKPDIASGSDLIKHGYPIWVYMGYLDKSDNIISHPFDDTKYNVIPLVFGGVIAGMTQDKTAAGSRILINAMGYNWYLSRFTHDKKMVETNNCNIITAFDRLFNAFHASGGDKIPPIMETVLRLDKTTSIPQIRYIYGAHKDMQPINISSNQQGWITLMEKDWTILQGLMNIERIYGVDIEWEQNGYLTVHGRRDPLTRVIKQDKSSDERIHNVVVGGNVLNIEHHTDSTGIVSNIIIVIKDHTSLPSNIFPLNRDFIRAVLINEYVELFGVKDKKSAIEVFETETFNLFPGRSITINLTALASADVKESEYDFLDIHGITDKKLRPPISRKLLAGIIKRIYFWGIKGSAMIVGNPFIREGDIVQVTDISTDRSDTFIDFNATRDVLESLSERLKTLRTSDIKKLEHISDRVNPSYGIPSFTNIFYIWKVTHYLGEKGFWTKIHFVKQREVSLSDSNIMNMLLSSDNRGKDKRMGR